MSLRIRLLVIKRRYDPGEEKNQVHVSLFMDGHTVAWSDEHKNIF